MIVGVLKEPTGESRVSLLPEQVETLRKKNVTVYVENGAGKLAFAEDTAYTDKGAKIVSRQEILSGADLILSINPISDSDINAAKKGAIFLGVYQPLFNFSEINSWASKGFTVFSMDMIPRTTRAQSMDVLSSQANIAGYKAVLTAANLFPRYFPMFMTAAGSIAPAKVLILGAGVAGLQAIATARRLGAVVEVFDTRPAVKEEVMSLGAKFIEVEGASDASKAGGYAVEQSKDYEEKQSRRISEAISKADIVITTAQIPGKKAPLLVPNSMLGSMKHGSIIVDLAASTGGNTEQTKNNDTVQYNGVTIVGNSNLSAGMPFDASKMYGKNILNFLALIIDKDGNINLNFEDDLVKGTCIAHNGEVTNSRVKELIK
ncbi:MAG: NAD(P)(+) transhydrogenase (Re/Si-specific) subunit alpha [Bacteroidetes bacterium]|nr:MAG: NAD(P)(+) transhydrogenase (Re/Si-specific) subunit alpha [Bacteroidota bacterium]